MKIFIYLPNWLGDAVMAAAAINKLKDNFIDVEFTFYGSYVACELYKSLGNVIYEEKKSRLKQIRNLKDNFDIAISFKASLSSKILLFFVKAKTKLYFNANKKLQIHQVQKYVDLLKPLNLLENKLNTALPIKGLKTRKYIAIAAGANYGAAKCYEPSYFAKIASTFKEHKIIILGTNKEKDICDLIETQLKDLGINPINLCGKTNIKQLVKVVSMLDYLLANDSGIMHIGASFNVKVLAFFGATNIKQTSPFTKNAQVFYLGLDCSPCMKRICPLKHHNCMKLMTPEFVLSKMR